MVKKTAKAAINTKEKLDSPPRKLPAYLELRYGQKDIQSSLRVLGIIEDQGAISQTEVAVQCGATQPFANMHLKRLHHERLIKQVDRVAPKGGGRPYALWGIDRESNLTIGIAWNHPELLMGLADFNGKVMLSTTGDISQITTHDELLSLIDAFVEKAVDYANAHDKTIRFSYAGMPGHMNPETGELLECANAPFLQGLNLEKHFAQKFELSCMVHGPFARWYGEARDISEQTVMVVTWEDGLGILTGCDGHLFFYSDKPGGRYRGAWDMGHIVVEKGGRACLCGQKGCLEAYVGAKAICNWLGREDVTNDELLAQAALADDPEVLNALNNAMEFLGRNLAWYVQFMGVEKIIFTGTMSAVFDKVAQSFSDGLAYVLDDEYVQTLAPQASSNPQANMIAGACYMAQRMFFDMDHFRSIREESSRFFAKQVM